MRLLEWTTRLDVGETIESDTFAPASVVVTAVHIALGLVVAASVS